MSDHKSTEQAETWAVKRNLLKSEKQRVAKELSRLKSHTFSGQTAGEAKMRLESFIYQNGVTESAVPLSKRGQLESLKSTYDEAIEKAIATKSKHKELSKELERLNKELIEINNLDHIQSFEAGGLEAFVTESISPVLGGLQEQIRRLNALRKKRDELQKEIERFRIQSLKLDENELIDASVSEHSTAMKNLKKERDRREAVKDLFEQIEQAINGLETQIAGDQETFATLLVDTVNAYTTKARRVFLEDLKTIMEKDTEYFQCAKQLLEKMKAKASEGVGKKLSGGGFSFFNDLIQSSQTHLIPSSSLIQKIKITVEENGL